MSNRLPVLTAEIRRAHADVGQAAQTAAQRAIDAGHALIEAKTLCAHGAWLPFLAEIPVGERTAQRYMALARSGLKPDTVTDLGGVRAALALLADPKAPSPGQYVAASFLNDDSPAAFVWPSEEYPGHYHIAGFDGPLLGPNQPCVFFGTKRPMKDIVLRDSDGEKFRPIWRFLRLNLRDQPVRFETVRLPMPADLVCTFTTLAGATA